MKRILFFSLITASIFACKNNSTTAYTPICDTACDSDSFLFKGNHKLHPEVSLTKRNCVADTLSWTHDKMESKQKISVSALLDTSVKVNKSALNCVIKDTSYAWLTFNDCTNGRGYILQLFFSNDGRVKKYTSALNSFDKKYVVDDSLRAYCDYTAIYALNVNTGKKVALYFKDEYKQIDFNHLHETIDSINFTRKRLFAVVKRNGQSENLEKAVKL